MALVVVVAGLGLIWYGGQSDLASALPIGASTPGPGAMTVYAVTNPNTVAINVEHVFAGASGFQYVFWTRILPNSTATYHVRDLPQVRSPFQGTLSLYADMSFSAQVTGYDYPASSA